VSAPVFVKVSCNCFDRPRVDFLEITDVTEGYATNRFVPGSPASAAPSPTSTSTSPFQSANETIRQVYATLSPGTTPPRSNKKRTRQQSEPEDKTLEDSDDDVDMADENDELPRDFSQDRSIKDRPMRPLRKPSSPTRAKPR
jgi:hypothetical protein